MLAFIRGNVIDASKTTVVVASFNGDVGYELIVNDPAQYTIKDHLAYIDEASVYFWIWTVTVQEQPRMYGFKTARSRNLAIQLAEVDGIGPTGAARLAQSADYSVISKLIADQDAVGLCKLTKGLGDKKAKAIIASLASQLDLAPSVSQDSEGEFLFNALSALGHVVTPRVCYKLVADTPNQTMAQRVNAYLATLRK
jgi:Holliday junction resolvasome RuvABC DNA-binding subunit